jgi:succinate dehydrogenase / fumarate reductase iron-sulfur subunit
MLVQFQILRQSAVTAARLETFDLDVEPSTTILDCLNKIKWEQDGTLAFRKNCRNTICGSCAIRINGRSALACKENIGQELSRLQSIQGESHGTPTMTIAPLGNMPVIKDLVVNMQGFWGNLKAVDPYVSTAARQISEGEFLQTPENRDKLNQMGNCILCGACYSECNALEVNPDFVGPHALAKAYRMVADSRDQATTERLVQYGEGTAGAWGCTRCFNCNAVCPMEVEPLDQISHLKTEILAAAPTLALDNTASQRAVRHRQAMIELVKDGGWIDERRFGLRVVSNNLQDLGGFLSLVPLGLRMLQRGKLPLEFHPAEGRTEVKSLITAVQMLSSRPSSAPSASTTRVNIMSEPSKTSPKSSTDANEPSFGWSRYAEQINGRFAMIGFVALLLLELFTHQDFFTWIGWR